MTSKDARSPAEFSECAEFGRTRQVEHREPPGNSQTAASQLRVYCVSRRGADPRGEDELVWLAPFFAIVPARRRKSRR